MARTYLHRRAVIIVPLVIIWWLCVGFSKWRMAKFEITF